MGKLIAMGELLIDFTADSPGELKSIASFTKNAGGAPANVAVRAARHGERAVYITALGEDAFGDFLLDTLRREGVDVSHIKRTDKANTALAFVSLTESGERDFSFYRNPSSDLLLSPEDVEPSLFSDGDIFHFGSVELVPYPVKDAHVAALALAEKNGLLVSFDPNLRFPLWKSREALKETVLEFIPKCHLLKISDEELLFLSGDTCESSIARLFQGNVQMIIVTKGKDGAALYTRDGVSLSVPGIAVNAVDTTGAGDAFLGAFLSFLLSDSISPATLTQDKAKLLSYLTQANREAAECVTHKGAL